MVYAFVNAKIETNILTYLLKYLFCRAQVFLEECIREDKTIKLIEGSHLLHECYLRNLKRGVLLCKTKGIV